MQEARVEEYPGGRRSKLETYCDILSAIANGAGKPTHIMYKANLSWKILQDYLTHLEAQGLVTVSDEPCHKIYQVTEKGFRVLNEFSSVQKDLWSHKSAG